MIAGFGWQDFMWTAFVWVCAAAGAAAVSGSWTNAKYVFISVLFVGLAALPTVLLIGYAAARGEHDGGEK